jgi:multisubunit Na+/H+ antiporter MnhE subunit
MGRRLRFWLAWYVPLVGLWLLFVDTFALEEVVLGLVAAALAATAADLVRVQDRVPFRLDPGWLAGLAQVPGQVVRDSGLLALVLWRRLRGQQVRGSFSALPFPVDADEGRSAARRALVTAVVSLAPNTYVVGIEGDEGRMLVHHLVPTDGPVVPPAMLRDD